MTFKTSSNRSLLACNIFCEINNSMLSICYNSSVSFSLLNVLITSTTLSALILFACSPFFFLFLISLISAFSAVWDLLSFNNSFWILTLSYCSKMLHLLLISGNILGSFRTLIFFELVLMSLLVLTFFVRTCYYSLFISSVMCFVVFCEILFVTSFLPAMQCFLICAYCCL